MIDNYQFILDYLAAHEQKIDDIIFNADGGGDGLHPGDFVQKLMFENIISELDIPAQGGRGIGNEPFNLL